MDIQKFLDTMSDLSMKERNNYHLTFGKLIEALENNENKEVNLEFKGIGAYRGYYSDMALLTETEGTECIYGSVIEDKDIGNCVDTEDNFSIEKFSTNPKELAKQLKSLIGKYTDGYKGGEVLITEDRPLWLATNYGDCSGIAVIGIDENLKLITKQIIFTKLTTPPVIK